MPGGALLSWRKQKQMYFNTTEKQFDGVVAPELQFSNVQTQRKAKLGPEQKRALLKSLLRGSGILVASFVVVFAALYTIFTWPLVWVRGEYFVNSMISRPEATEVQAETPILPYEITDKTLDSDGDGYTDAEELAAGYDPYSKQPVKLDSDGDGIKDDVERTFYGTDPYKVDTDSDGYEDLAEIVNGHSPLRPANYGDWIEARTNATIRIPAVDITAPVVWSKSPDDIEDDLSEGVIHYPGTANPGEPNNVVITGHSSFWSFQDAEYGTIFALIDQLKEGDKVFIDYAGTTYVYEAYLTEVTDPYELKYFTATPDPRLTLMTCYPPGSTAKRYYVLAKLIGEQPILEAN